MRRVFGPVAAILLVAAGAGGYFFSQSREGPRPYRFARVERGPLSAAVSATGQLNAVITVQVGSQVSGQIKELLADFNSVVRKGQVIARLDAEIFQAKVSAARAELESAQAAVLNQRANLEKVRAEVANARAATLTAEANVERMRAELESTRTLITAAQANVARESAIVASARRELERRVDLLRRQLISQSEKDQAQTVSDTAQAQLEVARSQERGAHLALRSAQAQLAATESQAAASQAQLASAQAALHVAEAQLKSAEATVRQKQAALDQARVDLDRTEIRAPVNGTVVSRSVDVGQTVAASLQAPTLFTIAQDLSRMQVETNVVEADIGRIKLGARASFAVDAFPGETFTGTVAQIRKAAHTVQNVVTYTVVVAVQNPHGKLLPGMTANVKVIVAEKPSVLKVPNAALRFRPPTAEAETPGPASRSEAAHAAGTSERGGEETPREGTREWLVRTLNLTEDQQEKLKAILDERRRQRKALRDTGLSQEELRARAQKTREATRVQIREILTDDQRARYDQLEASAAPGSRAGVPGRLWVLGPDGTPKPVALKLGISDGMASEVLEGEVTEGQEVIVGLAGASPPPSRPAQGADRGPRLRLGQ